MTQSKVIDMAGRRINEWFVVERAQGVGPGTSKAKWWVVCPACGEQHYETGSKLRAAEQNRWAYLPESILIRMPLPQDCCNRWHLVIGIDEKYLLAS